METTTTTYESSGGGILSVIGTLSIIVVIVFILLAGIAASSENLSTYDMNYINQHCNDNSYFAKASDGNGTVVEFCLTDENNIGAIKYHNGKVQSVDLITEEWNLRDLLDYISHINKDMRLIRFKGGFIPAP